MERLAKKNGWFVPASTVLDHLLVVNGHRDITDRQRRRLERKWLLEKMKRGTDVIGKGGRRKAEGERSTPASAFPPSISIFWTLL